MREIKFRTWDKALNKMVTQENVKELLDKLNSEEWETEYPYSRDEWYPAYQILGIFDYFNDIQKQGIKRYEPSENRFEIMQYTGLKDKNAKEIYEGDIVYVLGEDENAIIAWEEESSRFIIQFEGWYSDFDCYYGKDLEVIGNIYENSELLEE